jgi:multiple sugar transport system ATP-binding protein
MNFINVKVSGDGQASLAGDGLKVPVPERLLSEAGAQRGQDVIMGIRPEDLKDARFPGREDLPKIPVKVDVVENMGSENFVYFTIGGKSFTSRMDPRSSDIQPGQNVQVAVDTTHIHLFDPKTEKALVSRGAPAAAVPAVAEAPAPPAR